MAIKIYSFILLLVSPLSLSSGLPFDVNKSYNIYEVQGRTYNDINASFHNRPDNLSRHEYDAYTAWKYNFNTSNRCKIQSFSLHVTYTLPRLNLSKSYPESREDYQDFLERLYRHEEQHCAITVSQLVKIHALLLKGQSGNCAMETKKANKIDDDIIRFNKKFDIYTNHGAIELEISPFGESDYLAYCKIDFSPFINDK